MAKIQIAGGAAALVSTLKREEIELLQRYRPNALVLKEGDETVFRVKAGEYEDGSVSEYGVCFVTATRDEAALAEHTIMIPAGVTDVKAFAVDKIGPAVLNLGKVEAQAAAALTGLRTELDQVRDSVFIAA